MPEGSRDQMGGTMRLGARTTILKKGKEEFKGKEQPDRRQSGREGKNINQKERKKERYNYFLFLNIFCF